MVRQQLTVRLTTKLALSRVKRFFYWQAEEAREHCKACQIDVGEKRVDLANTKSEIITQIREMVSQCDLTLKAVSSDIWVLNVCRPFKIQTNLNNRNDDLRHTDEESMMHRLMLFVPCFR